MLAELFTAEHLTTFLILTALETVLGFDNLLYISIEAKRVGAKNEAYVRRVGTLLAIGLRIVLLFVVLQLISLFQNPFLHINMHLSIREQVSIDQPQGVRYLHTALSNKLGTALAAEHQMMDCLAEMIWHAQRHGTAPDAQLYLRCLKSKLDKL